MIDSQSVSRSLAQPGNLGLNERMGSGLIATSPLHDIEQFLAQDLNRYFVCVQDMCVYYLSHSFLQYQAADLFHVSVLFLCHKHRVVVCICHRGCVSEGCVSECTTVYLHDGDASLVWRFVKCLATVPPPVPARDPILTSPPTSPHHPRCQDPAKHRRCSQTIMKMMMKRRV